MHSSRAFHLFAILGLLAASLQSSGAELKKADALIDSRRAIKSGEITFAVTTVVDLESNTKGALERVRITFLNDLIKSETLQDSGPPSSWSLLGKDFLLYQWPDNPEPQYRKFKAGKRLDLPPGMLDPRLIGVKPDPFMTMGVDGFRAVIGRSDVSELRTEVRDLGEKKLTFTIEKLLTGSTVETAYDETGQPIVIETSFESSPGVRYGCRLDIVTGNYNSIRYPKEIDYRVFRGKKIEYHEQIVIETAKFNIPISEKDFDLNAQDHPKDTVVHDRGTGERKVIGADNTLGYGSRREVKSAARPSKYAGLRRGLATSLAVFVVALIFVLRVIKSKRTKKSEGISETTPPAT